MGAPELGNYLKKVRGERGLGLREVSRRSRELSWDSAWSISPAQLMQIERGHTKKPGLLKLATLAQIYEIEFENLAALLGEAADRLLSKRELDESHRTLLGIARFFEVEARWERDHPRSRIMPDDEIRMVTTLRQELLDAIRKLGLPLVPAREGQPPIPFTLAQQRLTEDSADGKTRRIIFRFLLNMKGLDLEDAAAAFIAATPRAIRPAVLRQNEEQGRPAKSTSKAPKEEGKGGKTPK